MTGEGVVVQISASYIAPSREELLKRNLTKRLTIVQCFWPESENFDFSQKAYHRKGHEKRSRMTLISAS